MSKSKRRAYVTSIGIKDGTVLCDLEDADRPNRTYNLIPFSRPLTGQVVTPPIGSEVVVEKLYDEEWVISGVLSTAGYSSGDEAKMKAGSENNCGSVSFTFGPREGSSKPERFSIEYRESGYVIEADVDGDVNVQAGGDITISAGGNVYIDEGGGTKKVATEDHTHTDSTGGTTSKPDDVTSVELE